MLIDLEWDVKYAKGPRGFERFITRFDTTGGGLSLTHTYDDHKAFDYTVANRIAPGVYESIGLCNNIPLYTKWGVGDRDDELRQIFNQMCKTPREEDAEGNEIDGPHMEYRRLLRKKCSSPDYGLADNLKQVIKAGGWFIRCPEPFVLSVSWNDARTCGMRWHKQGKYIGRFDARYEYVRETPGMETIVNFSFIMLVPKQDV